MKLLMRTRQIKANKCNLLLFYRTIVVSWFHQQSAKGDKI